VLREEFAAREPSVVIAKSPCVLQFKILRPAWSVDPDLCNGCKVCLRAGCTALSLANEDDGTRRVEIAADVCNGCGVCAQMCKFGAISGPEAGDRKDAR
jgi:indolepyruvate ferredoxin oxidoreductase, alpha subunit